MDLNKENGEYPAYAWPGGYPIYYMVEDNGILCPGCANGENGSEASEDNEDRQWKLVGMDVHWEGESLLCDHCEKEVESAYGIPEVDKFGEIF